MLIDLWNPNAHRAWLPLVWLGLGTHSEVGSTVGICGHLETSGLERTTRKEVGRSGAVIRLGLADALPSRLHLHGQHRASFNWSLLFPDESGLCLLLQPGASVRG